MLGGMKQIMRVRKGRNHMRFDLDADPAELKNLALPQSSPTKDLRVWMQFVDSGLMRSDEVTPQPLDEETIEQLRALGYTD